ncbi:uncharacterized protein [Typha angustifolia]|uniref:uncharacterized protein n=1 Tax=Typha angustifolia TaxID=59011 RepID=UPI003C2B7E40
MADGGLTVLDGSQLRGGDLHFPIPDGAVTGAKLVELAESEVAARLYGVSLPETVRSAAIKRMGGGDDAFLSEEFVDAEPRMQKVQDYLLALADELKDDPLVISILDGRALRPILDDEDDFAMLAEDLFTDLDVNDKGKISKSEMRNALTSMGVELGVPLFSESSDLLNNIMKKYGADGEEQLGQAQFAELLQLILQDLADALAKKHVTVIQNIKVINGAKLKKILADKNIFDDVTEGFFKDWTAYRNGEGNKEKLYSFLEDKGSELGLPPSKSNEAVLLLYNQIFSGLDEEKVAGDLTKNVFQVTMREICEAFAQRLEANPVLLET